MIRFNLWDFLLDQILVVCILWDWLRLASSNFSTCHFPISSLIPVIRELSWEQPCLRGGACCCPELLVFAHIWFCLKLLQRPPLCCCVLPYFQYIHSSVHYMLVCLLRMATSFMMTALGHASIHCPDPISGQVLLASSSILHILYVFFQQAQYWKKSGSQYASSCSCIASSHSLFCSESKNIYQKHLLWSKLVMVNRVRLTNYPTVVKMNILTTFASSVKPICTSEAVLSNISCA